MENFGCDKKNGRINQLQSPIGFESNVSEIFYCSAL